MSTNERRPRVDPWVERVFEELKVLKDGVQVRPVTRDDLEDIRDQPEATGETVIFESVDMPGIDLRGLDLGSFAFRICVLTRAIAFP